MGIQKDGSVMASGGRHSRLGLGSSGPAAPQDESVKRNRELHRKLKLQTSTSVPVSGVDLHAKTG